MVDLQNSTFSVYVSTNELNLKSTQTYRDMSSSKHEKNIYINYRSQINRVKVDFKILLYRFVINLLLLYQF